MIVQSSISDGFPLTISLYNKLRLTGGLHLTDNDRIFINNEMENKIFQIEKDSNLNYERFR